MWYVQYSKNFEKSLSKIDKRYALKILTFLDSLQTSSTPTGFDILKMSGRESDYRCRIGMYRIIYNVNKNQIIITLLDIAHRKDVYK